VFLCTKLISNYTLVVYLALNLALASQFGSDWTTGITIAVGIQMLLQ